MVPEGYRRVAEIIDRPGRHAFRDLRVGDVFRLFEADGSPVDGGRWYRVDADLGEDRFGVAVLEVTPCPTSPAGPDY